MDISRITLDEYSKTLQYLRNTKGDDIIDNDTVEHAERLVSELVNSATEKIRLYTTRFCEEFYNRAMVKQAFSTAAERGVIINILSKDGIEETNSALIEYKTFFKNNIVSKQVSGDVILNLEEDITLNNFMLIDEAGLRYEQQEMPADGCKELKNVNARGAFNRPNEVKLLATSFDSSFN